MVQLCCQGMKEYDAMIAVIAKLASSDIDPHCTGNSRLDPATLD